MCHLIQNVPEHLFGDFVIISYYNEYYLAQMTPLLWKWPTTKDEIWCDSHEVVKKIKPIVEVNKRGFFSVKELEKHMYLFVLFFVLNF